MRPRFFSSKLSKPRFRTLKSDFLEENTQSLFTVTNVGLYVSARRKHVLFIAEAGFRAWVQNLLVTDKFYCWKGVKSSQVFCSQTEGSPTLTLVLVLDLSGTPWTGEKNIANQDWVVTPVSLRLHGAASHLPRSTERKKPKKPWYKPVVQTRSLGQTRAFFGFFLLC